MNPFDLINSITFNKDNLLNEPESEKFYNAFLVNRGLSYFPDCIFHAQAMNENHHLPGKMQYDYLRHAIVKKKRFSKWNKSETNQMLEIVKQHYKYSYTKAVDALRTMSEADQKKLLELYTDGYGGT